MLDAYIAHKENDKARRGRQGEHPVLHRDAPDGREPLPDQPIYKHPDHEPVERGIEEIRQDWMDIPPAIEKNEE